MKPRLIALGVLCLAVSSVCDNIRAPLLPLLSERFGLGYGLVSRFLVASSISAFAFSLLASRLIERLGERAFLMVATALQAAALLTLALTGTYPGLLASGALWGAGNSSLGMCANLLVIAGSRGEARSRTLSFLHLFYGVFSMLTALYVAKALGWGLGFGWILALPGAAVLALAAASPAAPSDPVPPTDSKTLPRGAASLGIALALYVVGEVICSMWLVTYLKDAERVPLEQASRWLGFFFLALTAGRGALAAAGALGGEERLSFAALGAALGFFALGLMGKPWAFGLAGFAMGPFFPVTVSRISMEYPDRYRGLLALIYSAMTLGIGLGHALMGWVAETASLSTAFKLPLGFFGSALLLLLYRRATHGSSSR